MLDKIALVLTVLGGINWGLVGLFRFDLVSFIFGDSGSLGARLVYVVIAACAIWCISLLFRENRVFEKEIR